MISINYEFGDADVSCSTCSYCESIKGFDGQISFDLITDKLKKYGWEIIKEKNIYRHFCPNCKKNL